MEQLGAWGGTEGVQALRRGITLSFTNVPARVKGNLALLERVHEKKVEQAV